MSRVKILVYSHGIAVYPINHDTRTALLNYCRDLAQWEYVKEPPYYKPRRVMTRVFAGATADRSEFRFHRNQLNEVITILGTAGIWRDNIDLVEIPTDEGVDVDMAMPGAPEPYGYQPPLIDYLANPNQKIKVTELQTGKGKTYSALKAAAKVGKRTVIQLRGGYVNQWVENIKEYFHIKKGDILVLRGKKALKSAINLAKAGEITARFIIVTSRTMYALFKEYEKHGDDNIYGIRPEEFYQLLGVGLRIVDEAHEDYHFNFRSDIYSNVQSAIHLSATLLTDDSLRRRMYEIALPRSCWYTGIEYDKYVGVKAYMFSTKDPHKLVLTERNQSNYSHGAYETSIMKDTGILMNYLEVIREVVQKEFIEYEWDSGQKCIVFCRLVEFCETVRDYLAEFYPELDICVYVAGTDDEVLKRADIIVSTVGSAGTAIDIKRLKTAVLTQALNKRETNEQVKGRLRKLRDKEGNFTDITPVFAYLVNTSVKKHRQYHDEKKEQFKGRCLFHREYYLPVEI